MSDSGTAGVAGQRLVGVHTRECHFQAGKDARESKVPLFARGILKATFKARAGCKLRKGLRRSFASDQFLGSGQAEVKAEAEL